MAFRPLRHDGRLAATRWSRSARWFSAAASTVMTRLTVADARLFVRPSRQLRNSSASSSTTARPNSAADPQVRLVFIDRATDRRARRRHPVVVLLALCAHLVPRLVEPEHRLIVGV